MTQFQEEIRRIAEERRKRRGDNGERETKIADPENIREIKDAMEGFFSLAGQGVKAYNEFSGENNLSIYELPSELLTLFLSLPGRRMGFCIIGLERFVFFLDEAPNQILVLGQKRQAMGASGLILSKAIQLIKITCIRSMDALIFKDNTGASLNPEDIVKHIIRWVSE